MPYKYYNDFEDCVKQNPDKRIFQGWISAEKVDNQGDRIAIDAIEKKMEIFMKRGGPLIAIHSNKQVGRCLDWQRAINKEGEEAIQCLWEVYKDYEVDDRVWEGIKQAQETGEGLPAMSIGATHDAKNETVDTECENGVCYRVRDISEIDLFEVSVVDAPANESAIITEASLAKRDLKKKVVKRGNKWCVIHCHGPKAGEVIACHDTREAAEAQHRAIQANKGDVKMDLEEIFKDPDGRPPKEWWDNCIGRAESFATDPQRFCGALWHHLAPSFSGKQPASMREAFGKSNGPSITEFASFMVEKCGNCRELVSTLKGMGIGEDIAMSMFKTFLDKMTGPPMEAAGGTQMAEEKKEDIPKQEEPDEAPPEEEGVAEQMTVEELAERLANLEKMVTDFITAQDQKQEEEKPEEEEMPEEEEEEKSDHPELAKAQKKIVELEKQLAGLRKRADNPKNKQINNMPDQKDLKKKAIDPFAGLSESGVNLEKSIFRR